MQQEPIIEKLKNIEELLRKESDNLYSFQQACEYLRLRPSYLYKLTALKKIPCYKPSGKKLFFFRRELDEWIREKYGKKAIEN